MVLCILLASKTERGKLQEMKDFINNFLKKVDQKDIELFQDMFLMEDTPMAKVYHLDLNPSIFDKFAYLKALEIEICRSLNFEFFVHNPIQNIHNFQSILYEYFKQNEE